ncbi:D-alanyl-D-alanine carboxypeptidase/D-alanyl-D-alanine-endopeptidase [Bifidobacterium callitrichos]|uniref:D-alanyl-d-alanine carboxypeptidase n=1 Tax=Bifidobacterium callitrichos DSM 23973 TaxID=1437609 RepID=A0A087ABJ9_9BIFI|nr:D-alanyl-D-alanine carboxypeptidase [Bifidobacterium callitrichos]KFI56149.1 d-alanyl-d-alanine carboxypeptidase [Bifidobacterium callitrichos DSM 23973]
MSRSNGRRPAGHRVIVCALCVVLTAVLGVGYAVADAADAVPGLLTMRGVATRSYPDPSAARAAGTVSGDVDLDGGDIDKAAVARLIDELGKTEGIGTDFSVAVADARGNVIAEHEMNTLREPASTTKTLTAYAAANTLEMGSTLDTEVYLTRTGDDPTIVLKGNGDMLLGAGDNDPTHINGRAGLATLADRTAAALRKQGVTRVALATDDSLFGDDRTPSNIIENNAEHRYYTAISSMAIDGGRDWTGLESQDRDSFTEYPILSEHPAIDAANTFKTLLSARGITVTDSTDVSGQKPSNRIASVSSAPLNEVMAFMLRHSDNTLAELFGRLTALKLGTGNSIAGDVKAVERVLKDGGISIEGMTLSSCSGLAPGTRLTVRTLVEVQSRLVDPDDGAAAALEGLSVPGLVGTARSRVADQSTRGLIRVKTGSLDNVRSLAGNISLSKGGVLAFAVIVNNPVNAWEANKAVDSFAAGLAKL